MACVKHLSCSTKGTSEGAALWASASCVQSVSGYVDLSSPTSNK